MHFVDLFFNFMLIFTLECIQFINLRSRKVVDYLLSEMSDYIDVIVPRGGKGLVGKVKKFSKVISFSLIDEREIYISDKERN